MTVILLNILKGLGLLRFQLLTFVFMFDILSEKIRANILSKSKSVSDVIPNI